MNILIVGGGGREHALAWRLAQSPSVKRLIATPGNPGIAQIATCIPAPGDLAAHAAIAEAYQVDLTIVGPEAPLVAGIVDHFRSRGLEIIGPTQAAAQLEGSKLFAKKLFAQAEIPTARSADRLERFGFPVVIKADGLAAGKGVIVAQDRAQAEAAIARLGPDVVIEEFLEGEEVSFIGLSNGETVVPLAPAQDHKRIFDGDQGPNTGGMGAYCDARILTAAQTGDIMERIMLPTVHAMRRQGTPFTGFLYAGLMMTTDGPKVLEFNARLGDPETQALMYSFRGDFAEWLRGDASAARWETPSVCVVASAHGYPDQPRTGDEISGIDEAEATGATVFQAGTRAAGESIVTSGGRVLSVAAGATTLPEAIQRAYAGIEKIHFDGMHYRHDIGRKGLSRWYTSSKAGT